MLREAAHGVASLKNSPESAKLTAKSPGAGSSFGLDDFCCDEVTELQGGKKWASKAIYFAALQLGELHSKVERRDPTFGLAAIVERMDGARPV